MARGRQPVCPTCHLPIIQIGLQVPCSTSHSRCLRCGWPVAKQIMPIDEICQMCRNVKSEQDGKDAAKERDE